VRHCIFSFICRNVKLIAFKTFRSPFFCARTISISIGYNIAYFFLYRVCFPVFLYSRFLLYILIISFLISVFLPIRACGVLASHPVPSNCHRFHFIVHRKGRECAENSLHRGLLSFGPPRRTLIGIPVHARRVVGKGGKRNEGTERERERERRSSRASVHFARDRQP